MNPHRTGSFCRGKTLLWSEQIAPRRRSDSVTEAVISPISRQNRKDVQELRSEQWVPIMDEIAFSREQPIDRIAYVPGDLAHP